MATSPQVVGAPARPRAHVRDRGARAELLPTVIPAIVLTAAAIARYATGKAGIDLAIFDQALWTMSRTAVPSSSLIGDTLLGDHFAPGVLAFAPLYRIVASPIWLLLAQGFALWAAVAQIAARLRGSLGVARTALVGTALMVTPAVAWGALFEFHPVTLAIPFGLAALFAIEDGDNRKALTYGLVAALFRMEIGMAVAVALCVWPGPLRPRVRALGVLGAYLAVAVTLDGALGHADYWAVHYAHLGASPSAALAAPGAVLGYLLTGATLHVVVLWLSSGGMLALGRLRLAAPAAVVALPLLLSSWGPVRQMNYHYWVAPTLLLAAAWIPVVRAQRALATVVIVANLALAALLGPLTPALQEPLAGLETPPSRVLAALAPDREVACLTERIPTAAAVSAGDRPASLLAHRMRLYPWPYPFRAQEPGGPGSAALDRPAPQLAAAVDYVVIPSTGAPSPPEGFYLEAWGPTHAAYVRGAEGAAIRSC